MTRSGKPWTIRMIVAGHILVGWVSGFVGALHFTALYYYRGGFFYSVSLFLIFSLYSLLTFWFFAAAKLADKQSKSTVSFHALTLIFCLVVIPAHGFIIRRYLESMHHTQIHQHFGVLLFRTLDIVRVPLILYALGSFAILLLADFERNIPLSKEKRIKP